MMFRVWRRTWLRWAVLGVAVVATVLPAVAQPPAPVQPPLPPLPIPVYEKMKVVTDLALSDKDVLPILRQVVEQNEALAKMMGGADPKVLGELLGTLKRVRIITCQAPDGAVTAPEVLEFYEAAFTKEGWRRIVWRDRGGVAGTLVMCLPDLSSVGVVEVRRPKGKPMQATVTRTEGMLDMTRVLGFMFTLALAEKDRAAGPPGKAGEGQK